MGRDYSYYWNKVEIIITMNILNSLLLTIL